MVVSGMDEGNLPWIGDGSIKLVAKGYRQGKWRLQWTIVVDGNEQKVDRVFEKKADAAKWRDEKKVELRTGAIKVAVRSKAMTTLQGAFDHYAGTKEAGYVDGGWVDLGAAATTVATRAYRWNKWVKDAPIASLPLRALTRVHARAHVKWMKEKGASIQTVKDCLDVLKVLVNTAIRELPECGNMAGNPFEKLTFQSREEKAAGAMAKVAKGARIVTLSPEAARNGIAKAEDLAHRARLAVHLLTGLRTGEGMALCREQLDFDRRVIVVDRAVRLDGSSAQYVGLPKGEKVRLVAMCPTLAAILENYVATLAPGRSHLFGQDRKDRAPMQYKYYRLWHEAVEAAKLPKGLIPKGCRVSLNNWVEKLMPEVSISTRLEHMGHALDADGPSGVEVNLVNYTEHLPEAYEILRKEIERVIGIK